MTQPQNPNERNKQMPHDQANRQPGGQNRDNQRPGQPQQPARENQVPGHKNKYPQKDK